MEPLIPVEIIALLEEPNLQSPVVILHSREPNKVIPIWIGHPEAQAIALALENMKTERPLTHELVLNTIEGMSGKISKVTIDRVEKNTYYATISVTREHQKINIDARPSDAIALAIKSRVPMFMSRELLEKVGQDNPFEPHRESEKKFTEEEIQKMQKIIEEARQREQKEQQS